MTYETVLLRERRRMHALVAAWLAANSVERAAEFLERIAEQYRLAGDAAAAAVRYQEAGQRALGAGRSTTAARSFERARGLWHEAGYDAPLELVLGVAEANLRNGSLDACERALDEAAEHANDANDATSESSEASDARRLYLASWLASERGDLTRERELLERVGPLAERVGGDIERSVLIGRAWFHASTADYDQARELSERALRLAEDAADATTIGAALSLLAWSSHERGDFDEAMAHTRRAVDVAHESGDMEAEARALGNVGVVHHLRGDLGGDRAEYANAARYYAQHADMSQRLGLQAPTGFALANLAQTMLRLDDVTSARDHLAEAVPLIVADHGDTRFCLIVGAELRFAHGATAAALELLGAVMSDEGSTSSKHEEVERVLHRFDLPSDVVESGMAAGAGRDLASLADQLLAELTEPPH